MHMKDLAEAMNWNFILNFLHTVQPCSCGPALTLLDCALTESHIGAQGQKLTAAGVHLVRRGTMSSRSSRSTQTRARLQICTSATLSSRSDSTVKCMPTEHPSRLQNARSSKRLRCTVGLNEVNSSIAS